MWLWSWSSAASESEARDASMRHIKNTCHHASMAALLLGRTMIGERMWDVSRAIDALEHLQSENKARIDALVRRLHVR
ncbi:MAG: hypothetical protein JWN98_1575 [Abditibacteriota bacterium]|nr:hypothetical protein [Abditibacteriota bacterium]